MKTSLLLAMLFCSGAALIRKGHLFEDLDANNDDAISVSEAETFYGKQGLNQKVVVARVKDILSKFDANPKDGVLERIEYESIPQKLHDSMLSPVFSQAGSEADDADDADAGEGEEED
eukprot:TRINITY_DN93197_c0_g1_i1.p1 TRINITY_DN93197_c0_g1~~TRINITY_DN93197_c0_g1_i1.p1  ORF type:complete len:118 (-),score=29.89 TRINITY_DN93197_c0_g1_i1:144-497(-)